MQPKIAYRSYKMGQVVGAYHPSLYLPLLYYIVNQKKTGGIRRIEVVIKTIFFRYSLKNVDA